MFERYTERARQVIFFARYEATQTADPYIETQHLLLGLMRTDAGLLMEYLSEEQLHSIRQRIESEAAVRNAGKPKLPTSVDLPLSNECKRILAYSAEEAERSGDRHIGVEHLLLGLLRGSDGLAAKLLTGNGIELATVRENLRLQTARPLPVPPGFEERHGGSTAQDCIEFIDAETSERVGIIGIHSRYPLPRATDFVLLQPGKGQTSVRYEVLEVIFEYQRPMASPPYTIQQLNNITVKVRRTGPRDSRVAEST